MKVINELPAGSFFELFGINFLKHLVTESHEAITFNT